MTEYTSMFHGTDSNTHIVLKDDAGNIIVYLERSNPLTGNREGEMIATFPGIVSLAAVRDTMSTLLRAMGVVKRPEELQWHNVLPDRWYAAIKEAPNPLAEVSTLIPRYGVGTTELVDIAAEKIAEKQSISDSVEELTRWLDLEARVSRIEIQLEEKGFRRWMKRLLWWKG